MKRKLLFLVFVLLLSACEKDIETNKEVQNKDRLYILYATPLVEHPIWLQSKEGFEKACDELQAYCKWSGPKVIDTDKMNEVVYEGIIQKADGIITQGVIDSNLFTLAAEHNVPIVLVDSNINNVKKFSYYGKDFHEQANLLLQEIEQTIGKNKLLNIGIQVAELDFEIAQKQIQEIRNVFNNHPGGYEIIEITDSNSDKIRAQSEWMNTFRNHPEINVAINFAAESADACGEVVKTLHIKDRLLIYGVDDMDSTINYIQNDMIDASIVTSFYEYGYNTVYQIYDYKKHGKKPEQIENKVKLIVVNKDNVNTYKKELKK